MASYGKNRRMISTTLRNRSKEDILFAVDVLLSWLDEDELGAFLRETNNFIKVSRTIYAVMATKDSETERYDFDEEDPARLKYLDLVQSGYHQLVQLKKVTHHGDGSEEVTNTILTWVDEE